MDEIASYSVAMTSVRYQQVEAAYQQNPERSNGQRSDPFSSLTSLTPKFSRAIEQAAAFERPQHLVKDLMDYLMPADKQDNQRLDLFNQFRDRLLEKLV